MARESIHEFLLSYCAAFNRFDPAAVSAHYALPAQLATKDGQISLRTPAEAIANSTALVAMYKNWGYSEAQLESAQIDELGERFATALVQWEVRRHGKLEPWRFRTYYIVSRVSGSWKIIHAVAFEDLRMHPLRGAFVSPAAPNSNP